VLRGIILTPITVDVDPQTGVIFDVNIVLMEKKKYYLADYTEKKMKDLKIGDYVFGIEKGKLTKTKILNVLIMVLQMK
jgi:hypothetical protein